MSAAGQSCKCYLVLFIFFTKKRRKPFFLFEKSTLGSKGRPELLIETMSAGSVGSIAFFVVILSEKNGKNTNRASEKQ